MLSKKSENEFNGHGNGGGEGGGNGAPSSYAHTTWPMEGRTDGTRPRVHRNSVVNLYTRLPFIRDSVDLRLVCPKIVSKIQLVLSQNCPQNFLA